MIWSAATETIPACSAGSSARGSRPSLVPARMISPRAWESSAAATSNSSCVSSGSPRTCSRYKDSTPAGARPTANGGASWAVSCSWLANSSRANGLPSARSMRRSRMSGSTSGWWAARRVSACERLSPSIWRDGNPAKGVPATDRAATITTTASASSRLAANASATADSSSSHPASSARHSSGRSPAAADSRLSTAAPIRNRFAGRPGSRPRAAPNATD
jgi:hypothetical protein